MTKPDDNDNTKENEMEKKTRTIPVSRETEETLAAQKARAAQTALERDEHQQAKRAFLRRGQQQGLRSVPVTVRKADIADAPVRVPGKGIVLYGDLTEADREAIHQSRVRNAAVGVAGCLTGLEKTAAGTYRKRDLDWICEELAPLVERLQAHLSDPGGK